MLSNSPIGLFKSHHSLGNSILTLESASKEGERNYDGPDSIVDMALEAKIPHVFLIEDSFSGFFEAYKNFKAAKINYTFGLRLTFVNDMDDKSEESRRKEHKAIILLKSHEGYAAFISLYTEAATRGYYYYPRLDFKTLKTHWNSDHLDFWVPHYDSFLMNNAMLGYSCLPKFSFLQPKFLVENNGLPCDNLVTEKIINYAKENKCQVIPAKSIFYDRESHFPAYLTFKCINKRSTLDRPELQGMSSNQFCLEAYQKQIASPEEYFPELISMIAPTT